MAAIKVAGLAGSKRGSALVVGQRRRSAIGKTVQPETGKLLLWNNLLPNGRPNEATLHQGLKVRRGVKYILTQWYRERPLR